MDVLAQQMILQIAQQRLGLDTPPLIESVTAKQYPYSKVNRMVLRSREESSVLYVKEVESDAKSRGKNSKAKREFDALERLYDGFCKTESLRVPRPIGVIEDSDIIITEEVRGRAFSDVLSESVSLLCVRQNEFQSVLKYCRKAGEWLRLLHGMTHEGYEGFNVQELLDYCKIRLDYLVTKAIAGVDCTFRARVLEFIHRATATIAASDNIVVGRHNDFSPHNIVVNGEILTVLDFGYFDRGSYGYDVCRFWHQMESMKWSPFTKRGRISKCQEAFLEGYGADLNLALPIFQAVFCREYVTRMATLCSTNRSWPINLVDEAAFKRCHDWLRNLPVNP